MKQIISENYGSFEYTEGGVCAAKGFKASGYYCGIKAFMKTGADGKAKFTGLEHGIYYITMVSSPDPRLTGMSAMLVSTPNKGAEVKVSADAKYSENKTRRGFPPAGNGEHYESIDEYETALGLGNIQMHVGVCFE